MPQSRNEIEPNNTKSEAEAIEANNETASDFVSRNFSGQYVINGQTSSQDSDWFKVFLSSGKRYMTCNGTTFKFDITNEDNSYNFTKIYTKTNVVGPNAYELIIPKTGYYYIKIEGVSPTPCSYLFFIGSPSYLCETCTVNALEKSINMNKWNNYETATFDFTKDDSIPDEAIVYLIMMDNLHPSSVKDVRVYNSEGKSVPLVQYAWEREDLVSMNMEAKDKWKVKFTYKKDITITPKLILFYVFPVIS